MGKAPCLNACSPWTDAELSDCSSDADLREQMRAVATDILFELSGRQFPGSCQDVVRPCVRDANWCGCRDAALCTCSRKTEIVLDVEPVTSIQEIRIDGVVVDPLTYRVDDYKRLIRLPDASGQNDGWPCCQNPALADDAEGVFEVTINYGQMPPRAGVYAAEVMACEMIKAAEGQQCRLPQRVTSVTRQGISYVMLDPFNFLDKGRTGIPEVDLFLATYNRGGLRRRGRVWSPDTDSHVRRTNTAGA